MDEKEIPARTVARRAPEKSFDGIWIEIGDESFSVPPLSMKRLKVVVPLAERLRMMKATAAASEDGLFDTLSEIIFTAVQRNYPSLDRDDFGDKVDMKNAMDIVTRILTFSGLQNAAAPGGEPGETPPPSTGG